jgi:hypothetical protein
MPAYMQRVFKKAHEKLRTRTAGKMRSQCEQSQHPVTTSKGDVVHHMKGIKESEYFVFNISK